jgi:hypothetical protein
MSRSLKIAGVGVGGAVAAAAAALAVGGAQWNRASARAVRRLSDGAAAEGAVRDRFAPDELAGLPAPVARYFTFALTMGQPLMRRVRLLQEGTFARARDSWAPFTAVEDLSVSPPGFVWDARIRMAPLIATHVRDSYLDGEGVMHGKLAGLVTVVDQRGTPEMAASSLLRYLAESPWLPNALLPSAGVRWEAVDERSARATLSHAGVTASMQAHFGPRGEIERITAERHRDVNGAAELTPWEGRFSEYARLEGMMVPLAAEVGWMLPDGWFPYWRGRTVEAQFTPAAALARR